MQARAGHTCLRGCPPQAPQPPRHISWAAPRGRPVSLSTERSAVYPAKKPMKGSTAIHAFQKGRPPSEHPTRKEPTPVLPEAKRPRVLKLFSHNKYPKSGLGAVITANPEKTPWHESQQREQQAVSTHTVPHRVADSSLSPAGGHKATQKSKSEGSWGPLSIQGGLGGKHQHASS